FLHNPDDKYGKVLTLILFHSIASPTSFLWPFWENPASGKLRLSRASAPTSNHRLQLRAGVCCGWTYDRTAARTGFGRWREGSYVLHVFLDSLPIILLKSAIFASGVFEASLST